MSWCYKKRHRRGLAYAFMREGAELRSEVASLFHLHLDNFIVKSMPLWPQSIVGVAHGPLQYFSGSLEGSMWWVAIRRCSRHWLHRLTGWPIILASEIWEAKLMDPPMSVRL
jgi:hypothetical protein